MLVSLLTHHHIHTLAWKQRLPSSLGFHTEAWITAPHSETYRFPISMIFAQGAGLGRGRKLLYQEFAGRKLWFNICSFNI